jgi:antitoxin component YwqK of YwqJK toxin-antitoxin module
MLKRVLAPIEFSSQYSYSAYRYEGEAFTGIEYRIDKEDRVIEEQSYFEGMRWGFSRSWRDNQTLRDEYCWKNDGTNGNGRKFYLDGQLKEQSFREGSILIWRKRWSKQGELIEDFNLENEPGHETYKWWERRQHTPEEVETPEMLEYEKRAADFEQEISEYLAKYPSDKIHYGKDFINYNKSLQ